MLALREKIKNMQSRRALAKICRMSRIYAKSSRNLVSKPQKAQKTAPKL